MARANLRVDESLSRAWADAADAPAAAAAIAVRIEGEACVARGGAWPPGGVWARIAAEATEAANPPAVAPVPASPSRGVVMPPRPEPRVWLLRLPSPPAVLGTADWLLVAFTPEEGVHPRIKMLYASARDDIRRTLGAERFAAPDYHVSDLSELSEAAFSAWSRRDSSDVMSMGERHAAAYSAALAGERAAAPPPLMATLSKVAVPFTVDVRLKDALAPLSSAATAESSPGWFEVRVGATAPSAPSPGPGAGAVAETLTLAAHGPERSIAALQSRIPACAEEPRFFICRVEVSDVAKAAAGAAAAAAASAAGEGEGGAAAHPSPMPPPLLLVYHCPEGAKPKARMSYSTAKPALLAALSAADITVTKTAETRDEDDVTTALTDFAANPHATQRSGASIALASADAAQAEAVATLAASAIPKSPVSRFGGRALPGFGMGTPGALPGMTPGGGLAGLRHVVRSPPQ